MSNLYSLSELLGRTKPVFNIFQPETALHEQDQAASAAQNTMSSMPPSLSDLSTSLQRIERQLSDVTYEILVIESVLELAFKTNRALLASIKEIMETDQEQTHEDQVEPEEDKQMKSLSP